MPQIKLTVKQAEKSLQPPESRTAWQQEVGRNASNTNFMSASGTTVRHGGGSMMAWAALLLQCLEIGRTSGGDDPEQKRLQMV